LYKPPANGARRRPDKIWTAGYLYWRGGFPPLHIKLRSNMRNASRHEVVWETTPSFRHARGACIPLKIWINLWYTSTSMKNFLEKRFPLIKDKNICLYYLYSAIYGLYPINAVVALYFIYKGLSFAQIGIIFTVFSLSSFLFEIPTGYFGDRYGRKKSILAGLWTLTAVAFTWTLATNYMHFSILAAIWMLGFAFMSGSFEAYIYDYLEEHKFLEKYDGVLAKSQMLFFYFGSFGAIIGTFLYATNHNLPYYLLGITFFASSIAVLFMDTDVIKNKKAGEDALHLLAGLKKIVSSRELIWITLFISFFFGYYHFFINSVNSPYILSLKVIDIKLLGTFMAIVGFVQGTMSSKFDLLRKKFSDTHLITILSLVQVLTLLVMGYYTGIVGLVGIFIPSYLLNTPSNFGYTLG